MKRLIIILGILMAATVSTFALETPQYPGGDEALEKYIATNLKYPTQARENGIEGVVTVCFIVNTDGKLSDIKIEHMVDPDLEEEALRLVKGMPAWTPADKGGNAVVAPGKVSVTFSLE
ncbi:MAG: energy transducer TonB [Bacteroides sp.]|nr:energy transducer TonB [Bacteroides sp.]